MPPPRTKLIREAARAGGSRDLCKCGHERFHHSVQHPPYHCYIWQCRCKRFELFSQPPRGETMKDKNATYTLPPELAVALTTNRTEFVKVLRIQVEQGKDIPRQQIVDVLHLVEALIDDRYAAMKRLDELRQVMRYYYDAGKGILKKAQEVRALLDGNETEEDEG